MNKIFSIDDDEDDHVFFRTAMRAIHSTLYCEIAMNGKTALDELRISYTLPDINFMRDKELAKELGARFFIKTLMTYKCSAKNCNKFSPQIFQPMNTYQTHKNSL